MIVAPMMNISDKYLLEKMKLGIPPTYSKEDREKEEELTRIGRALEKSPNVTIFVNSYQICVDVQNGKHFKELNI